MTSVLQKFHAMKEERLKFITDTQSKARSCFSINNTNKNYNNFYSINTVDIETVSTQLKQIASFITKIEYCTSNYKNGILSCVNELQNKLAALMAPQLTDEQLYDINTLIYKTTQMINEYKSLTSNESDNEERIRLMKEINSNFNMLSELLKVDFACEKENINKVKYYTSKIKTIISNCDDTTKCKGNLNKCYHISKSAKWIYVKENNDNSNISSLKVKYYNDTTSNKHIRNYDININVNITSCDDGSGDDYFSEMCMFVKMNIMKEYIMIVKESKYPEFKCVNICGVGKSHKKVERNLIKVIKHKRVKDGIIKVNIYDNIELMLYKKFIKMNNTGYLYMHYNFDDEFIKKVTLNTNNNN